MLVYYTLDLMWHLKWCGMLSLFFYWSMKTMQILSQIKKPPWSHVMPASEPLTWHGGLFMLQTYRCKSRSVLFVMKETNAPK